MSLPGITSFSGQEVDSIDWQQYSWKVGSWNGNTRLTGGRDVGQRGQRCLVLEFKPPSACQFKN